MRNTRRKEHARERVAISPDTPWRVGRGKRLFVHLFLCAVCLEAAFVVSACGPEGRDAAARPRVIGVTVAAVGVVPVDKEYEAQGIVRSNTTSVIASRVMGTVMAVHVQEGDMVSSGQLLVILDDADARQRAKAARMAAEAAYRNKQLAQATWRRYKALFESKAVSRQDMDRVQTEKDVADADYERARAVEDEARTFLSYTRILATHKGVVTKRHMDPGSMASPGMPLLTIEGLEGSYLEVNVEEGLLKAIQPGDRVKVVFDGLGQSSIARVREVIPEVDPMTHTFRVKIDTSGVKGLRPGMFGRAVFSVGTRDAVVVPQSAVVIRGQLMGVYVVDREGIATFRIIREGALTPGGLEVLAGLKPKERVVVTGVERVTDGAVVVGVNR